MNQIIYETLKQVARAGSLLNYTDVGTLVGLDMDNPDHRNEMSNLLDEISLSEHRQGRPLLSVVVIRKDLNKPGNGFFDLAKRLGLYKGHNDIDQVVFFSQEFQRATECWRKL
jgi:hypothetical protein